jgi:class 3 adenylate cyclase/HAMP domain-containing protein
MRYRFTIFQKQLLGFVAVLLLTALIATAALRSLYYTNSLVDEVLSGSVEVKNHALMAESEFQRAVTHDQHFLMYLDTASVQKFKKAIDTAQIHVWAIMKADSTKLGGKGDIIIKRKAAEFQRMIDQYFRGFSDIVWEISLRAEHQNSSFTEIVKTDTTIQRLFENYSQKTVRASILADEIVRQADLTTQNARTQLAVTRNRALITFVILTIGALFAGILISFFLSRRFARSIIEIRDAAQKVAGGMRAIRVNIQSHDELEELGTAFNAMVGSLDAMFKDIEEMFVEVQDQSLELASVNEQNQALLLNVLPNSIAERLKSGETLIADEHESATILFADIVGFTQLSSQYPAIQIVEMLNWIFSIFDDLSEQYGLEKIKTIGDSYMVAGGVPLPHTHHAEAVAEMGLAIIRKVRTFSEQSNLNINVRVGIHTGHVVAGVIGQKRFIYDLWGDTVNTASRMESSGEAGRVHISEAMYEALVKTQAETLFIMQERGEIEVKGKGKMRTYFLVDETIES